MSRTMTSSSGSSRSFARSLRSLRTSLLCMCGWNAPGSAAEPVMLGQRVEEYRAALLADHHEPSAPVYYFSARLGMPVDPEAAWLANSGGTRRDSGFGKVSSLIAEYFVVRHFGPCVVTGCRSACSARGGRLGSPGRLCVW